MDAVVPTEPDGVAFAAQMADVVVAVDGTGRVLRTVAVDPAVPMMVERAIVRLGLPRLLRGEDGHALGEAVRDGRPIRLESGLAVETAGRSTAVQDAVVFGRPVGTEYLVAIALGGRRRVAAPGETAFLLDRLDRSVAGERRSAAEADALLQGLAALTSDAPAGDKDRALFAAFAKVLPYDLAVVLAPGAADGSGSIERASRPSLEGRDAVLAVDPREIGSAVPLRRSGTAGVLRVGGDSFRALLALRIDTAGRDRLLVLLRAARPFDERETRLLCRLRALVAQHFELETRRQATAELRRASDLGDMLAGVAHELKQPLATISLAIQNALLLLARGAEPAEIARRLGRIETYCAKAGEIADAMRELAHPDMGTATAADAGDAVRGARLLIGPAVERADIVLDCRLDDPLPSVRCHPVGLRQALINLLANARDAIAARRRAEPDLAGRIVVDVRREAAAVVLRVADNGGGVPDGLLPRLFREKVTTKPVGTGTGLGLGIVARLVRDAGGTAEAENGAEGAVITLRLPVAEGAP